MQKNQRPIDEAAQETLSWWDKSFVFIKKTQVKTWQAVFITAFVAGAAVTLVWTVSNDYHPFSRAAGTSGVPANSCLVVPPGGYFSQATAVNIKCGSNVKNAFYQWDNLGKPQRIGLKGANTKYPAQKDMKLKVYGEYKKPPVYGYGYGYSGLKNFQVVYYFKVQLADSYGAWYSWSGACEADSCNGAPDSSYTCPIGVSKSCRDIVGVCGRCSDGECNARDIICYP